MNIVLWVLQVLLAAAFAAHGWMLVSPPADLVEIMNEQLGVGFRLFLGVAELMAAVGLILPGLTRILPWVISLTALCLMVVVGSATVLHFIRNETDSAVITALLFVVCGFVAYMRWRVKPIAPHATRTATA
ncbi:MAG: DoxX family protein [Caldilineaceae bacterium]|nr:DoxX family protein [Caldilineaceae bacterium]